MGVVILLIGLGAIAWLLPGHRRGLMIGSIKYVGSLVVLLALVALIHSGFNAARRALGMGPSHLTVCTPDSGMDYNCDP